MINLTRILLFVLVTTLTHAQEETNTTIEIEMINIDSNDGQMLIGLYDSEGNWLNTLYKGAFGTIENGRSTAVFQNIPNGTYAISVFHDEDNDGELDTLFGIPTEDTGSSNDAPAKFGPPKWADAKFEVTGGRIKQIINL